MLRATMTLLFAAVGIACTSGPPAAPDSDVTGDSKQHAPGATSTTEIVLLGTLHGFHSRNVKYSADILRAMIVALEPSAILVELPPTINGQATVKGGRVSKRFTGNENAAANLAANALGVELIPYDRKGRNEFYKETRYFERQKRTYRRLKNWAEALAEEDPESVEVLTTEVLYRSVSMSQGRLMRSAGPEVINSSAFDLIILNKKCIQHKLWPKMLATSGQAELAGELLFFRDEWQERNRIMADNVRQIAKSHVGKRLVVLCGAEHRYILREMLGKAAGITLKEFYEVQEWAGSGVPGPATKGGRNQSQGGMRGNRGETAVRSLCLALH